MIVEKLYNGLTTTAIGLITVFCVLVLLWGMVELMRIAMSKIEGSDKKYEATAQDAFAKQAVEVKDDNNEIVAAISAAIAVYLDAPQSSFKIKSFKRVGSNFKR